jgi:bacteriorhodopsin
LINRILSYLFSAYTYSKYKWGFFAIGQMAHFALLFSTLAQGHSGARRVGYTRDHMALAGYTNFIWLLYPIAFGLSDGGNRIGVTPSLIFFGILDLLLVPVLAYAFIFLARKWDYNRLNLAFTQHGRVAHADGTFPDKRTGAGVNSRKGGAHDAPAGLHA